MEAVIRPVAYIRSDFSEKFGIPRQSGLVDALTARIVFEPEFRRPEAIRDIEGFSHLWLIWRFSQALTNEFHPTVRPPRLGGNRRVGVFASRAPYIPLSDCRPDALPGYTAQTRGHCLHVECPDDLLALIPPDKRQALLGVLACDPRPGYEDKPQEIYGLAFAGLDVGFQVQGEVLRVVRVNHQKGE